MSSQKLKYAPLKEVIFEIHWDSNIDGLGIHVDNGFDLAQGKFSEKLKPKFPVHKKLIPEGAPIKIFGAPMHQYWTAEFQWPVIQHGPGMMAINEVEVGYEWKNSFKPLIIENVGKLVTSYDVPLKMNKIKLQYVDAWDVENENTIDFLKLNLQTEIISKYPTSGILTGFSIQQNFELNDLSQLSLNISSGINNQNQKKSIILVTTIEKSGSISPLDIEIWLENAHAETSAIFKKMLNPEFYASLDQ